MRTGTLALLIASATFAGETKKSSHPYFDDQGTLQWFTRLADAQAEAKRENKLVLIEYGREP
jgi:hypothetical protein